MSIARGKVIHKDFYKTTRRRKMREIEEQRENRTRLLTRKETNKKKKRNSNAKHRIFYNNTEWNQKMLVDDGEVNALLAHRYEYKIFILCCYCRIITQNKFIVLRQ